MNNVDEKVPELGSHLPRDYQKWGNERILRSLVASYYLGAMHW